MRLSAALLLLLRLVLSAGGDAERRCAPNPAVPRVRLTLLSLSGRECDAGCSPEKAFCEEAGKCRCKPGWGGPRCEQCQTFPGCLHGRCDQAWQCVCEEGWVGSLCDRDAGLCSSSPCAANATCIPRRGGGYRCICPTGSSGQLCQPGGAPCLSERPCQNGGTCSLLDASSCLCPPGFSGLFCEFGPGSCRSNPCLNGGSCTDRGLPSFTCVCPPGFSGATCNRTAKRPAYRGQSGAASGCVGGPEVVRPERRPLPVAPRHDSLPAHAFHKLIRPAAPDLLKITVKETAPLPAVPLSPAQLLCFALLALLTGLIILGSAAIVFFGRCKACLANARYRRLLRRHRQQLLEAGGGWQGEAERSIHIVLPEKIRLSSYGKNYTSI